MIFGFTDSDRRSRSLGFQGKLCIHPEQVPIVNMVLSPPAAKIDWSRRWAFESAEAAGSASILLEGTFIDYRTARLGNGSTHRSPKQIVAKQGKPRAWPKAPNPVLTSNR
jgi:citrate lyase beta subunit